MDLTLITIKFLIVDVSKGVVLGKSPGLNNRVGVFEFSAVRDREEIYSFTDKDKAMQFFIDSNLDNDSIYTFEIIPCEVRISKSLKCEYARNVTKQ